ncbi:Gfo/Idh/MocA family oxidoreductase [Paenibacillus cisolokensis]|jgi:predicted dehydrogenase|uniref:Gfo/Idh/MocA family protein n=1 Tax=Paenibacillus cisolokensis TaxID=1658519 RepID=UPI003D2B4E18
MANWKIIVAGCGGMANQWVGYAAERTGAEIAGLVDIREQAAREMASRHGLDVPVFTDLAEAIRQTKPDIVFDITIPDSHYDVCMTALKAGCHVFGEKPLAANLRDARTMVAAAKESGLAFNVMQNRRYLRSIRAYRELIASGAIGKPGLIAADFFVGPRFGGFRDEMESPLLLDMAIHTFDQARFISGADPVAVYCHEFNPPGSWYKGNASALCIFEMSDGSVFDYRGSWCAQGAPTSWEASWRVAGSEGTAIWDGHEQVFAERVRPNADGFIRETERIEAAIDWKGREGHAGCLDEMFAALEEGRPAETDCADNLQSIAMVFGALESARTGRKVHIEELLQR